MNRTIESYGSHLTGKSLAYYATLLEIVRRGGKFVMVSLNLKSAKEKFCELCDCEKELNFEPTGDGNSYIVTAKTE